MVRLRWGRMALPPGPCGRPSPAASSSAERPLSEPRRPWPVVRANGSPRLPARSTAAAVGHAGPVPRSRSRWRRTATVGDAHRRWPADRDHRRRRSRPRFVRRCPRSTDDPPRHDVAGVHRSDVPACSGPRHSSPTSTLAPGANRPPRRCGPLFVCRPRSSSNSAMHFAVASGSTADDPRTRLFRRRLLA